MDKKILSTINDIKSLKIQGATNIAKTSVLAIAAWSSIHKWDNQSLSTVSNELAFARPTEPLTQNCVLWLLEKAKGKIGQSLENDAREIITVLDSTKSKSIEAGLPLIKNKVTVMTHCHSSAVTSIFKEARSRGIKFKVILTETRPKFQGHITAEELVEAGIDATMIVDSEAGFIISREDKIDIDLIMVGADAINTDGSAINKVGSYSLSLSANKAKIPLYVVASLLKFTPLPIIIEERPHNEVWENHPKKLTIINPAFDKIPAEFITGFITEAGIVKPKDIKVAVRKKYPWVFSKDQKDRISAWLKNYPVTNDFI